MTTKRARAVHYQRTSANPETWAQTDSYARKNSFNIAYSLLSGEQNVRAGRNSSERVFRIWYRFETLDVGGQVLFDGITCDIISVNEQSSGIGNCADVKAVNG